MASWLSIVQSLPPLRSGLRRLLGRTAADAVVSLPAILTLTLADSRMGLALMAGESLRLLTESYACRSVWHRHQQTVTALSLAEPDSILQVEAGERMTLPALVLEGTGTGMGRDSMSFPVIPGSLVPPGTPLFGGPFVVKLQSEHTFGAFTPQPRPAPVAPSSSDRYLKIISQCSLLSTMAAAFLTRSFTQTLSALLLVNARPAAVGLDIADLGASARVLRAGVTVVGTRPHRTLRLPDSLFLDGTRSLASQLELVSALPLTSEIESAELLARAAGVAQAAGFPWGSGFRMVGAIQATDGTFDGKTATAFSSRKRYTLGPLQDGEVIPEATSHRQRGNTVLVLRQEHKQQPLGLLVLRPRLAPGCADLVRTCQRCGVELAIVTTGDQVAAQALARRVGIPLLETPNAVAALRARQREGKRVAFVSDAPDAAAAFAACDLALGLTDGRFPLLARADLLAPDLLAVAAIIEAASRREATVRDSIGLSVVSNLIGAVWGLRGLPDLGQASRAVHLCALVVLADGWLRSRGGARARSNR